MFKFRCIHCDKKIAVPTEFAGKPVKCPGCGESTIVPFPSPEELEAAEEIGFSVRQAPSMALASRTCKQCGAILPPTGACIQCGFDPGENLKAAFDASLATILATPAPVARADVAPRRRSRRAAIVALCAAGVAIFIAAMLLLGSGGCDRSPSAAVVTPTQAAFIDGRVEILSPVVGANPKTRLQLSQSEAETMATFFPGMKSGTGKSITTVGAPTAVLISINQRGDKPFVVAVQANLATWHQGGPTQQVDGDLKSFLESIINPQHTYRRSGAK